MTWLALLVLVLILLRATAQLVLEKLNRRHVRTHAHAVPPAFQGFIDSPTYQRAVDYTLAKSRFNNIDILYSTAVLIAVLYSGVLPIAFQYIEPANTWNYAGFLLITGIALSILSLPLDYYHQFRLEEHFGFNTTTKRLWWIDHLKGWLLTVALGLPLLWLILKFVEWTGSWWWFWSWATLVLFQLLMAFLAPILILPLFNKFEPLPPGTLRERLLGLAARTDFRARSIQVMDGSKRSRHSNAFFTGFGNFRKIVLFDTLIAQLQEPELEAVLAHEIGHYKKKHIPRMFAASAIGSLAGLYLLSLLANQEWFTTAFNLPPTNIVGALLLFGLLSGLFSFWLSPLTHWWSRKFEYQADAFAAKVMGETRSLIGALRKLSEKNLSNLTPHPVYSRFYYSHPTLLERESALATNRPC